MIAEEKARAAGVQMHGQRLDFRTRCPRCSDDRKKKNDPCLHVTVNPQSVLRALLPLRLRRRIFR